MKPKEILSGIYLAISLILAVSLVSAPTMGVFAILANLLFAAFLANKYMDKTTLNNAA